MLKFKARHKKTGKIYENVCGISYFPNTLELASVVIVIKPQMDAKRLCCRDIDLLQYIGFKDKHGTEIYGGTNGAKGDYVKVKHIDPDDWMMNYEAEGFVIQSEEKAAWVIKDKTLGEVVIWSSDNLEIIDRSDLAPELLED